MLALNICLADKHVFAQSSLVLNGGVITISNSAKLVIDNPDANGIIHNLGNIVSEGEDNKVIWNIGTSIGTYTIPWGNYTGFTFPLTVNILGGSIGANGRIEFSTYNTSPTNMPLPSMVTHVNNNFTGANNSLFTIDRFWIIEATNYTLKPAVRLDFSYLDSELLAPNTITEANLQAQRFNSNTNAWGDWGPLGLGITATNNVGGTSLNVLPNDFYEAWTLVDNTQPLPIELLFFNGECKSDKIDLTWSTASETNNALFNIYKSINSKDFEKIHSTPGALASTVQIDYFYSDLKIKPDKNYQYKIEQVDVDGHSKTFNAIEVKGCKFHSMSTTIYFANETVILQNNSSYDYNSSIILTDALGQIISTKNWNTRITGHKLEIPIKLSSGIYFVSILKEGVIESHKFLVN